MTTACADDGRWHLLDQLTEVRSDCGLSVEDVLVLRALLTFLPKGGFQPGNPMMIVFPSNRSLSARCAGMEERTLRRHLARLEQRGLIARHASPSGKRFACRDESGQISLAYGFSLAPLLAAQDRIAALVDKARSDQAQIRVLRARIREHLWRLGAILTETDARAIRALLRRKPVLDQLRTTEIHLHTLQTPEDDTADTPPVPNDLSARDSHIDRHIQNSNKDSEESEHPTPTEQQGKTAAGKAPLTLGKCLEALKESLSFSSEPVTDWPQMIQLARCLAPMIGIGPDGHQQSERTMGPVAASLAILAIVEMRDRVRKPGAYLRSLCDRAARKQFSISRMINALGAQRFPAGNTA